ncbi:MAG: hypothetical protein MZW92_40305 [Comamonadaceae bacterium]|nr:hypothetical protein [Comamonadaceae bacterium]
MTFSAGRRRLGLGASTCRRSNVGQRRPDDSREDRHSPACGPLQARLDRDASQLQQQGRDALHQPRQRPAHRCRPPIPITFKKLGHVRGRHAGRAGERRPDCGLPGRRTWRPTDAGDADQHRALRPRRGRRARIEPWRGATTCSDKKGSQGRGSDLIGDRPPRTLNIQLAEPVDYRSRAT